MAARPGGLDELLYKRICTDMYNVMGLLCLSTQRVQKSFR